MSSAIKYMPEYPWNESKGASPTLPSGEAERPVVGQRRHQRLLPAARRGRLALESTMPATRFCSGSGGDWVNSIPSPIPAAAIPPLLQ